MEHEMALAKLESERIEDLIPSGVMLSENRSLLVRMNNIASSLRIKQNRGKAP